jgi:hypothetical protein
LNICDIFSNPPLLLFHSAIAEELDRTLQTFFPDAVFAGCTSDSASNMITAMRDGFGFDQWFPCFAHRIQRVLIK